MGRARRLTIPDTFGLSTYGQPSYDKKIRSLSQVMSKCQVKQVQASASTLTHSINNQCLSSLSLIPSGYHSSHIFLVSSTITLKVCDRKRRIKLHLYVCGVGKNNVTCRIGYLFHCKGNPLYSIYIRPLETIIYVTTLSTAFDAINLSTMLEHTPKLFMPPVLFVALSPYTMQ